MGPRCQKARSVSTPPSPAARWNPKRTEMPCPWSIYRWVESKNQINGPGWPSSTERWTGGCLRKSMGFKSFRSKAGITVGPASRDQSPRQASAALELLNTGGQLLRRLAGKQIMMWASFCRMDQSSLLRKGGRETILTTLLGKIDSLKTCKAFKKTNTTSPTISSTISLSSSRWSENASNTNVMNDENRMITLRESI